MTTESLSFLQYLLTHPLFLRLIVVVAVATMFVPLFLLAERLWKTNSYATVTNVKKQNLRRSPMTLSGQQQ
jgi:hypothetical protein